MPGRTAPRHRHSPNIPMNPSEPFLRGLAPTERPGADSLFVRVLAAGVLWAAVLGVAWYCLDAVLAL